jgi:hypothetical protein
LNVPIAQFLGQEPVRSVIFGMKGASQMPRYVVAAVLLSAGMVAMPGSALAVTPVGASAPTATQCTVASYAATRGITSFHRAGHLSYWHRITIPSQHKPTTARWSVQARSVVTAKYGAAGGATGKAAWLRKAVAKRAATTVAAFGQHTPTRARSGGVFTIHNHSGAPKHDIEFNGVTRFHGRYATTRCTGADSHGIGHVERRHGSWVTFGISALGVVQCGVGGTQGLVAKAALKHCKN